MKRKKHPGKDQEILNLLEWKLLQYMATAYGPDKNSYPAFSLHDGKVFWDAKFVREANAAARKFIRLGWITVDQYNNHRLNEAGLQAAKEIPKPEWSPPSPTALTDRDFSVLRALEAACRSVGWATPLDVGGRNGSHHSASLTKLTRYGYAECSRSGRIVSGDAIVIQPHLQKKGKGSRQFRITQSGIEKLTDWNLQRIREIPQ